MKEVKLKMLNMSSVRRDFVASHLRSQLNRLSSILDYIEEEERLDIGNTDDYLKEIEKGIRQIRKLCVSNN